jgi:hypothetical protein
MLFAPSVEEYRPAWQFRQANSVSLPFSSKNVPILHFLQLLSPSTSEYLPEMHSLHPIDTFKAFICLPCRLQKWVCGGGLIFCGANFERKLGRTYPRGHNLHVARPFSSEYFPT